MQLVDGRGSEKSKGKKKVKDQASEYEIETVKVSQRANERMYLPITFLGLFLLLLLPTYKNILKKRGIVRTQEHWCMGHGYGYIPLSARQLAGRTQIRDV